MRKEGETFSFRLLNIDDESYNKTTQFHIPSSVEYTVPIEPDEAHFFSADI